MASKYESGKIRRSIFFNYIGRRGDPPPEFKAVGYQLGVLKQLAGEGFVEEIRPGVWRLTRNGHLEGVRLGSETFQKGKVAVYKGERR